MTVKTTADKIQHTGNGTATVFSFSPIVIFKTTDIVVTKTVTATGVETVLVEGVGTANYSVSTIAVAGSTGSVTYPAVLGTELPSTETLTIKRVLPIEQTTDLMNQGPYLAEVQETALDKLVMIALQQQDLIDRSMKLKVSDTLTTEVLVERTASGFLRWNAAGDAIDATAVSTTTADASDVAPLDVTTGAAAAGTAADFSREDHVHALPADVPLLSAENAFLETQIWFTGADVASASALSPGAGNLFDVTGTTTITSITAIGVGTIIVLQFDGILTLTHHATNLVLPGGSNIITSAGSIGVFWEYATGDWRLISYADGAGAKAETGTVTWVKGADVASTGALPINISGNMFDITGTTAVTSMLTKGVGTLVVLEFDDIVLLTHHATNLVLPGATNITTSAGSIGVFYEYATGDWRLVSYVDGNGDNVSIGTNTLLKGADVASAAAPVINIDGNIFDITGTTTITSFPGKGVGTVVILQFDGALILTHNATSLKLPGGANITTAAGDTLTMYEHSSGNWTVSDMQRASGRALFLATPDFQSAETTITASTNSTIAHGLGSVPLIIMSFLKCTDAGGDLGYSQNDEVFVSSSTVEANPGTIGVAIAIDATNIVIIPGASITLMRKDTHVSDSIDLTKWKIVVDAWK